MITTAAKKGASGSGTIRQRPDGLWEARVTVGRNPGTGKPVRKSIYGKTQKEVKQKMVEIVRAVDLGCYEEPSKKTVAEWLDEWMETYCANSVKPLTIEAYKASVRTHIKPAIGAIRLQDLRGIDIQKLYNGMTASGLSPKTVKNVGAILHKSLSVAVKQQIIAFNPCNGAELPKVTRKEIKPLADAEIPLFLKAIETSRFRNAYALCLFCGLREAECLGLSWDKVDLDGHKITIGQQLQNPKQRGKKYCIANSTKSGKSRVVELPPIAVSYLRDEKRRQALNRLRAGELWSNSWNLVFTDEVGKYISFPSFYGDFKRLAASIGRPDARPHDLRHTAATVAIANGSSIKAVQSMLGHSTATFTLDVYAHTTDAMMKDTADRVQGYYDDLISHELA